MTAFTFAPEGNYQERIEAKTATLADGYWQLQGARVYGGDDPPVERADLRAQDQSDVGAGAREFCDAGISPVLGSARPISTAPNAPDSAPPATGCNIRRLIARPFLLCAMVLLAAAVSLRFFRFGGVQKMVMSGILVGLSALRAVEGH